MLKRISSLSLLLVCFFVTETSFSSSNVFNQSHNITHEDRARFHKQKGCVIWMTGLPASGKSTLAMAAEKHLLFSGKWVYVLDGDNIRLGLNKDLGFSKKDRDENLRRIAEVATLFADSGMIVITSFISPFQSIRLLARQIVEKRLGKGSFKEVFIKSSLKVCEKRDPKGLYRKARKGEISNFTGINSPYEEPTSPDLTIDTSLLSIEEAQKILIQEISQE